MRAPPRIGSYGEPLLVAAIVQCGHHGVVPVDAIRRPVDGNSPRAVHVLTQLRVVEISTAVDVDAGIPKAKRNALHAGEKPGGECLSAVARCGKAADLNAVKPQTSRNWNKLHSGGRVVGGHNCAAERRNGSFALRGMYKRAEAREN